MSIWNRILFITITFAVLFLLQYLVFRTFRKFIKSRYPDSKLLKFLSVYPAIIFNLFFIYIVMNRRSLDNIPEWLYDSVFIPFYIYLGAVIFIGLYLLIGKIIKAPFSLSVWILNRFKSTREAISKFFAKPAVKKVDKSRRAFIRTSAALVSGYAFVGSTFGVLDSDNYEINHKELRLDNLPPELKGTTITLLCDIHSGPYMKENDMKEYVKVVNELKSDFIMIPGDLTNSAVEEAYPFSKAFRDLKAPNGVFASLGNHDYFANANAVAEIISNETPIRILRNESEVIMKNGKPLCIMGVEDTRQSGSKPDSILMKYADMTIDKTKAKFAEMGLKFNEVPKVTLFHKPYFFDELAAKDLDLILSGHTHGGQVVLVKAGTFNFSFAGAVSKYISGLYEIGKTKMYISRGIGSVALPIRFNCPPEITKITLV